MKICEEDEDLIESEPTFKCLEPQLIEAKLMIPEICNPKQENFARFFDVKDIGKHNKKNTFDQKVTLFFHR